MSFESKHLPPPFKKTAETHEPIPDFPEHEVVFKQDHLSNGTGRKSIQKIQGSWHILGSSVYSDAQKYTLERALTLDEYGCLKIVAPISGSEEDAKHSILNRMNELVRDALTH